MILASTPESTPGNAPDPDLVTPGTIGFLVTLAIVIAAIFLIRDALRRVRRVRARSGTSDAYPIPLRRHVVPNQSTLSGPEDPNAEAAEDAADSVEDEPGSADDAAGSAGDESRSVEDESGSDATEAAAPDEGDSSRGEA